MSVLTYVSFSFSLSLDAFQKGSNRQLHFVHSSGQLKLNGLGAATWNVAAMCFSRQGLWLCCLRSLAVVAFPLA